MDNITEKLRLEISQVKHEMRNKVSGYIITALGLVAGLAWNDAIKSFIEHFFPANEKTFWAKLIYALIITFIVVIISIYLVRFLKKEEKKLETEIKKTENKKKNK